VIPSLLWKEYREQRSVWLALAGLAVVLVGGLTATLLHDSTPSLESGRFLVVLVATLTMAGTYGLVSGAMLLAGERESGTQVFLDTLPADRTRLWAVKGLCGVLGTLGQVLLLLLLVLALGLGQGVLSPTAWLGMLTAVALESLAWGLLGSALCRSVLPAAGVTALFLAVSWIAGGAVTWPLNPWLILLRLNLALVAVLGSLLWFGGWRLDRNRIVGLVRDSDSRWSSYLRSGQAVLWLTVRQRRVAFVWLLAGGVVAGVFLPRFGLVFWPVFSLLLGIMGGTGVFAGEQAGGAYRFLGDQRLPLGRVWTAKVAVGFGLVAGVALVALSAGVVHVGLADPELAFEKWLRLEGFLPWLAEHEELVRLMGFGLYFILWLAYGFTLSQLLAVVCQKSAVALVLTLLLCPFLLGLWLPSLVWGGLRAWQVLAVPLFLLAASRLVLGPWVSGRLQGQRAPKILGGCGLLVVAWMGGSFWHRVGEVPDFGEPFDVAAYVASLPSIEKNQAGRLITRAAGEMLAQEQEVDQKTGPPPQPARPREDAAVEAAGSANTVVKSYGELVWEVLDRGWRDEDRALGRWLDLMFEGEWANHVREAASLPLGIVADPRTMTVAGSHITTLEPHRLAPLFAARALHLQAGGDAGAGLHQLAVILALSRHMRNHATVKDYAAGASVESVALRTLDHWIQKLGPRAELLQKALEELSQHEARIPSTTDNIKAQYLLARNSLAAPSTWLGWFLGSPRQPTDHFLVELMTLSSQVPWEQARQTRLLNASFHSRIRLAKAPVEVKSWAARDGKTGGHLPPSLERWFADPNGPQASLDRERLSQMVADSPLRLILSGWGPIISIEASGLCRLHAARLRLALALYEIREGKPAASLQALIPHDLPELPPDPYSGQLFGYRISRGERLPPLPADLPPDAMGQALTPGPPEGVIHVVRPGQGILWSVGPDLQDDGGTEPDQDWIFLGLRWDKPPGP
jgi:hypothetical protein